MRTPFRSLLVAGAIAVIAGCSRGIGGTDTEASVSVAPAVDSVLRIAATQLQLHGYTVTANGENGLVTTPRPVPEYLQEGNNNSMKGRHWMVQVAAQRQPFTRGTRLIVSGFLLPNTAPTTGTGATTVQNAIPITREHRLFQEVRTITGWIRDAANRK